MNHVAKLPKAIREAREKGFSVLSSDEYFVRDRGAEWDARRLKDDRVVVCWTFNPNTCPAEPSHTWEVFGADDSRRQLTKEEAGELFDQASQS